jgi:gamma-butyrobetaine dioxygenase
LHSPSSSRYLAGSGRESIGPDAEAAALSRIESFSFDLATLQLAWDDGTYSRLLAIWLRDHCQGAECRDPRSGQRLVDVAELPVDVRIEGVERREDGAIAVRFGPDGHESKFDEAWLSQHAWRESQSPRPQDAPQLWDAASFEREGLAWTPWSEYLADPRAKRRVLAAVRDLGFALLSGVPPREGALLDVVRSFGFVRETNYGVLFDVRAVLDPSNLAFTNLGLGPHTDNPYRDPVPTLQLLHCIENTAAGGESLLVDGFRVAEHLRRKAPDDFAMLTAQPADFAFRDARADLRARFPLIELDEEGNVRAVRYNNRSIAILGMPARRMTRFYAAYRRLAQAIANPAGRLVFKMGPGDLVLFDNRRVLHARTPIESGGSRHLQGAYADRDGLLSTLRLLEAQGSGPAAGAPA